MATDSAITQRIFKNALLSVIIYALPVVALFGYLKITGERPWKDNTKPYLKQIEKYKTEPKNN